MDFSEKWGKDVDEAVRLALMDLKLTEDQVNVIVLEEPTKGFFGLGSKLAKVRVEKKPFQAKEPVVAKPQNIEVSKKEEIVKKEIKETPKVETEVKRERREEKPKKFDGSTEGIFCLREKPADLVELKEHSSEIFLREITEKMGLNLSIKVKGNDSSIYVEMDRLRPKRSNS